MGSAEGRLRCSARVARGLNRGSSDGKSCGCIAWLRLLLLLLLLHERLPLLLLLLLLCRLRLRHWWQARQLLAQ